MASTADLVINSKEDLKSRSFKEMSMHNRLKYIREVITVEPILACYLIAPIMCLPAIINLQYEIACLADAGYSDEVCNAIVSGEFGNFTEQNDHVGTLVTDMHSWNDPLSSVVPMILVLFLGSFSDRRKLRKPFLLIPIVGELICVASCIAATFYKREWPLYVFGILLTIVPSFFGSVVIFLMALYAYIADVSTPEMRTVRIGVITVIWNVCNSLVTLVSGKVLNLLGYTGVLIFAEIIYLIGFLYGYFYVKESREPVVDKNQKSLLADAFDPNHLIETFSLITKKIPGNNRLFIVIIMMVLFIMNVVHLGEEGLLFFYTHDVYFWPATTYVVFNGISAGIHCLGVLIGVALFVKIMKLSDYVVINISLLDKIIGGIILFFSKTKTVLYLVTCIQFITGVAQVGIRSLSTKVTTLDNLGKAQSLFGVAETIGQMLGSTVYNKLWVRTKKTYPGTIFLLSSFLFVISMMLIMWKYIMAKKKDEKLRISERELETTATPMTYIQTSHI